MSKKGLLSRLTRYRSAMIGLVILFFLLAISLYAVTSMPYGEAVRRWRGSEQTWRYNPRNAAPAWIDMFTPKRLPHTLILDTEQAEREEEKIGKVTRRLTYRFFVKYTADLLPSELAIVFLPRFEKKPPLVEITWITPDGREFKFGRQILKRGSSGKEHWYAVSQDTKLASSLGGDPQEVFFADPKKPGVPLKGVHKIVIQGLVFEPDAELGVKIVVYGTVHGLAGTDHLRRDITIALLWGTPVALAFGLAASLGISLTSVIAAALGAWFGGLIDALIQRLTEIRMVLPTLPVLIMVGLFYSKSLWMILAVLLILNIIESSVKTYRAMFLQEARAPYIEAARSYGAGHLRIVFRYLIPRIIPWLIPGFVLAVPSYVFLEASLAVLGLGDPVLPTWGKLLSDAYSQGALYHGYYYWVLEPAFFLMLTGFGFTLIGYTLDKIFNPRLREI